MNNSWRFFIVVEALLLMVSFWQLFHTGGLLFLFIIGSLLIFLSLKKQLQGTFKKFQLFMGILFIFISLISLPIVWFMVALGIIFIGVKGMKDLGVDKKHQMPWKKKQMMIIETTNAESRSGKRYKRSWFESQRIGSNVYEWDDINFDILSGDTIIDLGNTLLPKEDCSIMIQKGIGRTRILVPLGVAIKLEHSTFYGNVYFEKEIYHLKNESLKIYSNDFDTNNRRLKIVTNTLIGDIEVIRL